MLFIITTWCDFISYCPEFAKGKELYIYRVERDEEMIWQLRERLEEFQLLIQNKIKLIILLETIRLMRQKN